MFFRKPPEKLIERIQTRVIFGTLRALFPHQTMGTIIEPIVEKVKTPSGMNMDGEKGCREYAFNKERLEVAQWMPELFIILTYGVDDMCGTLVAKEIVDSWNERLEAMLIQIREMDVISITMEHMPSGLWEFRREMVLESTGMPYEVDVCRWNVEDFMAVDK